MRAAARATDDGRAARRCVAAAVRRALHAMRDSLPWEAAMHIGVRLPGSLREVYYEDCPSAHSRRLTTREEFLQRIGGRDGARGAREFLARAALRRIAAQTPYPKRVAIREFLPPHLQTLWPLLRGRRPHRRSRTMPPPTQAHLRLVSASRRARTA